MSNELVDGAGARLGHEPESLTPYEPGQLAA